MADLAQQVKDLCKSGAKEQWLNFTTTRGGGTRDPARHPAELLQEFINTVSTGGSFSAPAPKQAMGGTVNYAAMMSGMGGDGDLASQVKELQKADPNAKMQWNNFSDSKGSGVRDPARHTPEFLQEFLFAMSSGQTFSNQPGADANLAMAIKSLQKQSPSFKQIWGQFCMSNGGGRMDPNKHEHTFHVQFFEALTGAANGASPMGAGAVAAGPDMNPAKRARMGGMPGMMGMGGGGGEKAKLVERVKNFQKLDPESKELWNCYTDTYLGGNRDPNRHDESTLKEFCDNHGVPEVSMPSFGGGGGGGMGGGFGGLGGGMGGMFGGMGGMVGGASGAVALSPQMAALVDKVKTFQKSSPENGEAWREFAGRIKDPSKHEESKLIEFCNLFGLV